MYKQYEIEEFQLPTVKRTFPSAFSRGSKGRVSITYGKANEGDGTPWDLLDKVSITYGKANANMISSMILIKVSITYGKANFWYL